MNPAALNNAAQALNTAALNPAALLSGKKDQINFYVPKLPKCTAAAAAAGGVDETRFLPLIPLSNILKNMFSLHFVVFVAASRIDLTRTRRRFSIIHILINFSLVKFDNT